jgi:hypothetical protein
MGEGKLETQNHEHQLTLANGPIPKPSADGTGSESTEDTSRADIQASYRSNDDIDQCEDELDDGGCLAI